MMRPFEFPQVDTSSRYDGVTITLGEWHELGFYRPLDDDSWSFDSYSDEQYKRLCDKFLNRFYDREVSQPTAARWKRLYLSTLNQIMPKYKPLYKRVEEGIDPFQEGRDRERSRDIFSDYPQTMLSGNSDYASTGNDREADTVREGSVADMAKRYAELYNDVDVMILDELEHVLFTSLMHVTLPMF